MFVIVVFFFILRLGLLTFHFTPWNNNNVSLFTLHKNSGGASAKKNWGGGLEPLSPIASAATGYTVVIFICIMYIYFVRRCFYLMQYCNCVTRDCVRVLTEPCILFVSCSLWDFMLRFMNGRPQQYARASCDLHLLTLKVVSRVTLATSVPIFVFLGVSVLDVGPLYASDVRQHHRLMPAPTGRGHNKWWWW